ncbi:MAG TPA: hypothetical protein VF331_09680 [Polyangiales bacterium]
MLNSAYELRDLVRSEGPLEVYHAVERRKHRRVSVTLVRPEYALQAKVVDEFVRIPKELLTTPRQDWPEILAVESDDTGVPFVVFEVKAGQAPTALLDRLVRARDETRPVPETQALAAAAAQAKPAAPETVPEVAAQPTPPAPETVPAAAAQPKSVDGGFGAANAAAGLARTMLAPAPSPTPAATASPMPLTAAEPLAPPTAAIEASSALADVAGTKPAPPSAAIASPDDSDRAAAKNALPAKPEPEVAARPAEIVTMGALAAAFDPLQTEPKPGAAGGGDAKPDKKAKSKKRDKAQAKARGDSTEDKPKEAWVSKRKSGPGKATVGDPDDADSDSAKLASATRPASKEDRATRGTPARGSATAAAMNVNQGAKQPAQPGAMGEGARAAVALTEAQLNALRTMRVSNDDTRRRWAELLLLLLFLVPLQFGVPLLYQPRLVKAQEIFGTRTPIVAGAFAVVTVIAMVRVWGERANGRSPLLGAVSYVMQIVTLCVCVLSVSVFAPNSFGMLELGVRKALPWASSLLFLAFGVLGAVSGARNIAQHAAYALFVLMMSSGSLYGSYRVVTKSVQLAAAEHRHPRPRIKKPDDGSVDEPADTATDPLDDALAAPSPKSVDGLLGQLKGAATDQQANGSVSVGQRKEVGGSETEDLKTTDGLEQSRKQNQAALTKLRGGLGAVTPAGAN